MTTNDFKLPNLIIGGVHKAGTTSLYSYLAKHPQICPSYKKEIGFFLPLLSGGLLPDMDEYAKYFDHCDNERFRLEASPSYLYGKERIAEAIKSELEAAKILVILRNPADRLASYFSRAVSNSLLSDDISFAEFVALSEEHVNSGRRSPYAKNLRDGMYINYIPPWQRVFGRELRIVFFDDLENDSYSLITDICNWLELDAGDFEPNDFSVENQTLHYRYKMLHRHIRNFYMRHETFWRKHHKLKQPLRALYNKLNAEAAGKLQVADNVTISKLQDFYEPYNEQLGLFLQANGYKSLPAWLDF